MGGGGFVIDYGSCSGQTGGRKLPATPVQGVADGYGRIEIYSLTTNVRAGEVFDTRLNKTEFGGGWGAAGGANGQAGENGGSLYPIAKYSDGGQWVPSGGGGGGWGAKGGDCVNVSGSTTPPSYGGAGGKAVQTNGYAVTWLGGSDRAYGAVG